MTAFDNARLVEAESLRILTPFLEDYSRGTYWISAKGLLARCFQEQHGDVLFIDAVGQMRSVELKAERIHTGNLFLETWSNRNFGNREDFLRLGANPGWLSKIRADYLFYHFLDADALYIVNLWKLQRWAFGHSGLPGRIYQFPERAQQQRDQMNETVGRLVPIAELKSMSLCKVFHPRQANFLQEDAA